MPASAPRGSARPRMNDSRPATLSTLSSATRPGSALRAAKLGPSPVPASVASMRAAASGERPAARRDTSPSSKRRRGLSRQAPQHASARRLVAATQAPSTGGRHHGVEVLAPGADVGLEPGRQRVEVARRRRPDRQQAQDPDAVAQRAAPRPGVGRQVGHRSVELIGEVPRRRRRDLLRRLGEPPPSARSAEAARPSRAAEPQPWSRSKSAHRDRGSIAPARSPASSSPSIAAFLAPLQEERSSPPRSWRPQPRCWIVLKDGGSEQL